MLSIPSAEFAKRAGAYLELAAAEPLAVTSYGRARAVVLAADEFDWMANIVRAVAPDLVACREIGRFLAGFGIWAVRGQASGIRHRNRARAGHYQAR